MTSSPKPLGVRLVQAAAILNAAWFMWSFTELALSSGQWHAYLGRAAVFSAWLAAVFHSLSRRPRLARVMVTFMGVFALSYVYVKLGRAEFWSRPAVILDPLVRDPWFAIRTAQWPVAMLYVLFAPSYRAWIRSKRPTPSPSPLPPAT